MQNILIKMKEHFDSLQDRLACFCKYGVQVEGWFKGELITLLDIGYTERWISNFDREVKCSSGKKIDITLATKPNVVYWIEIKHWIGKQKGKIYDPKFYFADKYVGILKDVDKLRELSSNKWIFVFITPNPGIAAWNEGIEIFNNKYSPRHLVSHSNFGEFSETYFMGVLEIP